MFKNISWSRGFFRLWIIYALVVVITTGFNIYYEDPYLTNTTILKLENSSKSNSQNNLQVFKRLAILREKHPEYADMKDKELISELFVSLYMDMDSKIFNKKLGLKTFKISTPRNKYFELTIPVGAEDHLDSFMKSAYDKRLWEERTTSLQIGLGCLFFPLLAVLMIMWILLGFRGNAAS